MRLALTTFPVGRMHARNHDARSVFHVYRSIPNEAGIENESVCPEFLKI